MKQLELKFRLERLDEAIMAVQSMADKIVEARNHLMTDPENNKLKIENYERFMKSDAKLLEKLKEDKIEIEKLLEH